MDHITLFFHCYRVIFTILLIWNAVEVTLSWREFRKHRVEQFGFHWYTVWAWSMYVMSWNY